MKLPARVVSLVKASLFASFGAGFGASLAISIGLGFVALFVSLELTFDCSTLEYCGLTVANTLLAIVVWLAGTAGLAIFASIACYIFALPAVFFCGSILALVESRQVEFTRLIYWLVAGAVLGTAWWLLPWQLQWIPSILQMHEGEISPDFNQPSWPLVVAAGFGGILTAWLFRIWWRSENPALP
jgi:hypothetical protein